MGESLNCEKNKKCWTVCDSRKEFIKFVFGGCGLFLGEIFIPDMHRPYFLQLSFKNKYYFFKKLVIWEELRIMTAW